MAKSCFTDMLNLIQPSKFLVARNGFLLMVDCPECCRHLTGLNLFVISIGVVLSNCFVFFERQFINHLCWSSDATDSVVAVSLNFKL